MHRLNNPFYSIRVEQSTDNYVVIIIPLSDPSEDVPHGFCPEHVLGRSSDTIDPIRLEPGDRAGGFVVHLPIHYA